MKYKFYVTFLRILKIISSIRQFGNPTSKAPKVTSQPLAEEKVEGEKRELSEPNIYKLSKVICTASNGGSVINQNNEVYYSFLAFPWGANLHPTLSFPYLGKKKMMLKKAIFLITPEAKANYYHWVIDLLPRLLLTQEYQMQDFPDYQIILHHPERKYEESTLALLGIEKHKVVRLKSFEFAFVETLIITDFVTHDKSFPTWKKKLLNQIKVLALNNSPQSNIKKIYLRRGNQRKRRLIREEDLVIELTRKGFHSINLEDLTFVQQVRLLENAEVVIALHGAALTNIIFCKENTLIIELRSKVSPPEFYSIIAKAYGLRFETILLEPKYKVSQQHLANKEDLIITKQDERLLFTKLQEL